MADFWLYLDESGEFEGAKGPRPRSLIGGFVAESEPSEGAAWDLLTEVASHTRGEVFHATESHSLDDKRGWAGHLKAALERQRWHAVVFEHSSDTEILDDATTYLVVMCEGVAQLVGDLASTSPSDRSALRLNLIAALRSAAVKGSEDDRELMSRDAYTKRLEERLRIEEVRFESSFRRAFASRVRLGSAKKDPRLMVADLLCHLWYRRDKLGDETARALQRLVGRHRYATLSVSPHARFRESIQRGQLGTAIYDVVQSSAKTDGSLTATDEYDFLLNRLAATTSEVLDREISTALARTEAKTSARLPAATIAGEVNAWRTSFLEPLRQKLSDQDARRLGWADAKLGWLLLTACNHSGQLGLAKKAIEQIQAVEPAIAGQFVYLPLALEIRFAQAVHLTDSGAYVQAAKSMDDLADRLEALLSLVTEIWEETPTDKLRSLLWGKALGCSLQAWHKAARRDPSAYERARARSEQALKLFSATDDVRRQAGYRCMLEADANKFDEALAFLANALAATPEADARSLLSAAKSTPWSVMYWCNVWYRLTLAGRDTAKSFADAWKEVGLAANCDWLGEHMRFPGQLVAWKAGVAAWRCGQANHGEDLLRRAVDGCLTEAPEALRFIGLGVLADYSALASQKQRVQLIRKLSAEVDRLRSGVDSFAEYLEAWPQRLAELPGLKPAERQAELKKLAHDIPY